MSGPLNERYRSHAADIFNSGTHLLTLINEILDLSKLEAGQMELRDDRIDLASTIRACTRIIELMVEKAKIRLCVSISDELPSIRADETRMQQIVIYLLSNAAKFALDGGRTGVQPLLKMEML